MRSAIRCLFVTLVVLIPRLSTATILDPATLHIGPGAGTACATGCGGDPNIIGTNKLDIYQNSGGAGGLDNPILLILGIANTSGNFATGGITDTFINPYPGGTSTAGTAATATAGTYGLKSAVSGDYFGSMTAGQEVYSFLTLMQPTDNSNSFTNWAGVYAADFGKTATSFGIYVFALNSSVPLGANGLIDITFGNKLPQGTFVVAYGQDLDKRGNGFIYDTPFTEAGLVRNGGGGGGGGGGSAVPEPASLVLLGSGLVLAAAKYRKRQKKQSAD